MNTITSFPGAKRYLFSLTLLMLSICGFSQINIAAWDFNNWNPAPSAVKSTAPVTIKHAELTVSNLTVGAGINTTSLNYYSSVIFGGGGTYTQAKTLAEAITKNEYFEFTLTANSPKLLTVNSVDVCMMTQGTIRTFALFSSVNGFTAANAIATATTDGTEYFVPALNFPVTGHASLSGAVKFRIYGYGAADIEYKAYGIGSRATALAYDLKVNGTIMGIDGYPPTMPGSLTASSLGATSLRLSWTASTDDNEVAGYDVYNGTTLLGTTTKLFYSVSGLTALTNYTFKVVARDIVQKSSTPATVSVKTAEPNTAGDVPKLPIGMNVGGGTYYSTCLVFTDAMKMSGDFTTWYDGGPFNSERMSEMPVDENGYPSEIPYTTSDGKQTKVLKMLNSFYNGRYVFTFDGAGSLSIGGITNTKVNNNKYYIDFDGSGDNVWISITASTKGNHLKNFKLLPLAYENNNNYPTFLSKFLDGLRPFHALRFMDWINTNGSTIKEWNKRITKTYHTQSGFDCASYDYAIELANELDCDAWVTVPYMASDDFITQAARLWRDGLRPNRKVYCEYANEIWNWMFVVSNWIAGDNAAGHPNAYVTTDLAAMTAAGKGFPEKDAYMIARNFKLWTPEFAGVNAKRLVRVAAVQHGWMDNSRRILAHLFEVDGVGCDMLSPGGYFNYTEADHNSWLTRCGTATPVTPDETLAAVEVAYDAGEATWTDETAKYANDYGVGYAVYEGGQHMQPWMQGEWCYNQAVYDAQISPKMYEMYMKNFRKMIEPEVNCQLFMAFAYMGARENKYGSWGHLENMAQVGNPGGYMTIAPKYQALLDANTPKDSGVPTYVAAAKTTANQLSLYPNPAQDHLQLDLGSKVANATVAIVDLQGCSVMAFTLNNVQKHSVDISSLNNGVYLLRVINGSKVSNTKFVKQ